MKNIKYTKNIKRIICIFFVSLIFCFFFLNQESWAKGSFRTLKHLPTCDGTMPVKLNDNEIFFPGNWDTGARILNVDEEKFVDLGTKMVIPRKSYLAIKLDKDNVLISSGQTKDSDKWDETRKSIEIYNKKTNKFTLFKNIAFPADSILINDNEILTFRKEEKGNYFKVFNIKTKVTNYIGANFFDRATKEEREASVTDKDFNSAIYHKSPIYFLLNDGRVFIYEIEDYFNDKEITRDAVELYNQKTKTFEKIQLPKGIRLYITHVKLDNGKVLFIGSQNPWSTEVIEFDPATNKFQKYDEWNFPLNGGNAITIDNNRVLLLHGTVHIDDVFSRFDKELESAIYDVINKKISKVKIITGGRDWYTIYPIKIKDNQLFLFENKHKIKVYEY